MLEWKCCGLVIVELLQKRFKKLVVGSDTHSGELCIIFLTTLVGLNIEKLSPGAS